MVAVALIRAPSKSMSCVRQYFFFQAEDGIRDLTVTGVQTCALPISLAKAGRPIVFSICEWGSHEPWSWGPKTGNLWRTTDDIEDGWNSMLSNLDISAQDRKSVV